MTDKKVNFELTADPAKVTNASGKVVDSFKKMGDQAQESVGKINSAFGSMHSQTAGKLNDMSKSTNDLAANVMKASNVLGFLGTALAGISFVAKIKDQIDMADSLNKMSQKAGISVEALSSLSHAGKLADVDVATLTGGIGKLSKTVLEASTGNKEAAATFTALKVSVQDAQGQIKPTDTILLDLAERFAKMDDGATKTALAMRVFGKSGADLIPFLNQGKDGIKALQVEAERFGIVVSTDTARAAEQFNDNLTKLQSAGQGLSLRLANQVLPTVVAFTEGLVEARKATSSLGAASRETAADTSMQEWLEAGAMGAARLGDVLKVLPNLVVAVGGSFQAVWADISATAQRGAEYATVPFKLVTGGTPLANLKRIADERNDVVDKANQRYQELWDKPANNLEKYVSQSIAGLKAQRDWLKNADPRDAMAMRANQKDADGDKFKPDLSGLKKANTEGKETSRIPEWQNALEKQKLALREKNAQEGTDIQFSLAREAQFWASKKALTESGSQERFAVEHKYYDAQEKISRESFAGQIAAQKTAMADMEKNYAAALTIAEDIAAKTKARYGADSKEYANAQREVINVQKQFRDQRLQLLDVQINDTKSAAESVLSIQREQAQLEFNLGAINKEQLLILERDFQRNMHEIAMQALQTKRAAIDPDKDPVAAAQLNAQLIEQERAFQLAKVRVQNEIRTEQAQPATNFFANMEQQGNAFFTNMLTRTMTWKSAMASAFRSIGLSFVQEAVTKPMMAWVMKETGMTAATTAGVAVRSAAEVGGAAVSTATTAATATTNITTSAYETAANVYKSIAAIPYVGPFLAPAMAIAATGTVLALVGKIASASGGYDIPAGVNPLVQAHAEEMILPAKYANGFRNIIEGGGTAGGGGDGGPQITYNDHSGRLSQQDIRRNVATIAAALKDYAKKS